MGAPTTSAYSNSDPTDGVTSEATGSVSWGAGDLVVVMGVTEDQSVTMNAPTVTGLTLAGDPRLRLALVR